ncbi:CHAT domain-containing protein [Cryptosporangium arvum]|nr:CHAT domain-containing protein [Cryptosporangium arvum]
MDNMKEGLEDQAILSLALVHHPVGTRIRVELSGPCPAVVENPFPSPITDLDRDAFRWLAEDYLQLRGPSADRIAEREKARIDRLAIELSRAIFNGPGLTSIRAAISHPASIAALRVEVRTDDRDPWVPWEIIPGPGSEIPLSIQAASFVHTSAQSQVSKNANPASGKLEVLMVVSRPEGRQDVPFRSIASRVVRTIGKPGTEVNVRMLRPPTWSALKSELEAAARNGIKYDAVHFDGHGLFDESKSDDSSSRGYVLFESETAEGGADRVDGRTMGELLTKYGIQSVLLNACRSAYREQDSSALENRTADSFAAELLTAGVRDVMAMSLSIYVSTAARIIADVYDRLAAGETLVGATQIARRLEFQRNPTHETQPLGWAVPIIYQGLTLGGQSASDLETTHNNRQIKNLGEHGQSRAIDADLDFIGYDGEFLSVDRALTRTARARITGLAGSGKSSFVREFSNWAVATDLAQEAHVVELEQGLMESMRIMRAHLHQKEVSRVLIAIDGINDEQGHRRVTNFVENVEEFFGIERGVVYVILSGRATVNSRAENVIALNGLDPISARDVAVRSGWIDRSVPDFEKWLDWSRGLPAVINALPDFLSTRSLADANSSETRSLAQIRAGGPASTDDAATILKQFSLKRIEPATITSAAVPIAAALFQSHLTEFEWDLFRQLQERNGFAGLADDLGNLFPSQIDLFSSLGLVSVQEDGSAALHPLASIAARDAHDAVLDFIAEGTSLDFPDLLRNHWATFTMTISVAERVRSQTGSENEEVVLGAAENVWRALDISIAGYWWEHAFPLLRALRRRLLDQSRLSEWESAFQEADLNFKSTPEDALRPGVEDPHVLYFRLQADEAHRRKDFAAEAQWNNKALARTFSAEGQTIAVDDNPRMRNNRFITANMRRGDELRGVGSPECLTWYHKALQLAEGDPLRSADAYLGIARAYFNVPALRNSVLYEKYARSALAAALPMGNIAGDLLSSCCLSVGSAIWESIKSSPDANNAQRVEEAVYYLDLASEGAVPNIAASAHNNVGTIYLDLEMGDLGAARFLQACALLEMLGELGTLALARTNAAIALFRKGRVAHARDLAQAALELQDQASDQVTRVRSILEYILAEDSEP